MTELLDRGAELAAGRSSIEQAVRGHGSLSVVEGAPGIGKSALLAAFRAVAAELNLVTSIGRGVEVHQTAPFAVVRQMLAPFVRRRGSPSGRFTGAARHVAGVFDATAKAATPVEPGAVLEGLYWFIADLAEKGPLVLFVDDAHWVDEPSLRFLRFLQPRLGEMSVAVFLATRPLDPDDQILGQVVTDPSRRLLRPQPLSETAVRRLVSSHLRVESDAEFARATHVATGGNPFYLAELLTELQTRNIAPTSEFAGEITAVQAGGISQALRFRHAASAETLSVARALAVLGDGSPLEQVAALAELPPSSAVAAADALARRGMVTRNPGLAFVHPIVRAAVYSDLGPIERAAAHGRAAELLTGLGARAGAVASHLLEAEPSGDSAVVATLQMAANEALAAGAPESAVTYLRRAAAEPPPTAERAAVLHALGRAEMMTGDPAAVSDLLEAYSTASDRSQRAQIAIPAAYALFMAGRNDRAVDLLADAADEVADLDRDAALRIEAELGSIVVFEPQSAPQHQRLTRIDKGSLGDSPGERMMLALLGYRAMLRGQRAAAAVSLIERAAGNGELLQAVGGEATAVAECVMTLAYADEPAGAAALIESALRLVEETGSRHGYAQVCFWRSVVANRMGRPADAAAEAEASLDITRPAGSGVAAVVATAELVAALIELDRLDAAEQALRLIDMHEADIPLPTPFNTVLSARGRLRLVQGRTESGLRDLLECGRRNAVVGVENPSIMPWAGEAALAWRVQGNPAEAHRLANLEMAAATAWGTAGAIGSAKRVLGLLSVGEERLRLLRDACEDLSRSPARLEYVKAAVDLGAALRRANRRAEARELLLQSLELTKEVGAVRLASAARGELAALGVRVGASQRGVDTLTASELRVARLAAGGSSNREIAQALFVTTKTVEKHLANAYSKLGVESRRDLERRLPSAAASYPVS